MKRIAVKKTSPVRTVHVSARRLLVLETGVVPAVDVEGSIVWVRPVKGDTPESVAAYVENLKGQGAARVLPMPLQSEDAAVPASLHEEAPVGETVREVVEELLSKVKELPEKVRAVVENAMSTAGL